MSHSYLATILWVMPVCTSWPLPPAKKTNWSVAVARRLLHQRLQHRAHLSQTISSGVCSVCQERPDPLHNRAGGLQLPCGSVACPAAWGPVDGSLPAQQVLAYRLGAHPGAVMFAAAALRSRAVNAPQVLVFQKKTKQKKIIILFRNKHSCI